MKEEAQKEGHPSNEDTLFGLPIAEYAAPNASTSKDAAPQPETPLIPSLTTPIKGAEGECLRAGAGVDRLLGKIMDKLRRANVKVKEATKLDIQGLSLEEDVEKLESLYHEREAAEASLFRLKVAEASNCMAQHLRSLKKSLERAAEWQAKVEKAVAGMEKRLEGRRSFAEIRAGKFLLEKYTESTEHLGHARSLASVLASELNPPSSLEVQEDFLLAESLIKLSSEEERSAQHLVGLLRKH
ncbi:hypothetical protein NEDG_00205 [Nematocida displodere]|uniref:Uncharacterized protein n=1 Tax=Nematocida displodere TaxID=1805483 RepID=A0A177EK30_9MICR|nr:hypothetical protein NEDG_00205 [Nematocida displodere]